MSYPEIPKPGISEFKVRPNLEGVGAEYHDYDWQQILKEVGVKDRQEINQVFLCIDRHAQSQLRDKVAIYWEGKRGDTEQYTYGQLAALTKKFANVLAGLGVVKGDRIFTFMERVPELYVGVFGGLRLGAVVGPLFADFGPDPVRDRLIDSKAKVLITSPTLRARIAPILGSLVDLKYIIIIDRTGTYTTQDREVNYHQAMEKASESFQGVPVGPDDYSIMHYTSGTTGKPKGAVHLHIAGIQQYITGKWVLDLHPEDIYWCTADPGWVTGTSYGMIAPFSNGVSQVIYEGGFGASAWYRVIDKYEVTVWYTAPTAIRMLMKAGLETVQKHKLSSLRHICSVGEPLNPEAVMWGLKAFGLPIHDNWWQTETAAIMIANYPIMPVRPGSMGRPIPGIKAGILDSKFSELPPAHEGLLAIRPGWPSMFKTYWENAKMYESKFQNGWYITGDRAFKDKDGYFWFVGRDDDVIKSAGHMIGPFEVESALLEHPAVAEAGVIGKPDPLAMEIVKAFVSLKGGYEPTPELRLELLRFAKGKLAAATAPRDIEFVTSLPKTRSGKIMRRLLKARELGLDLGDTSTLEDY